jgi:hypothetical protein
LSNQPVVMLTVLAVEAHPHHCRVIVVRCQAPSVLSLYIKGTQACIFFILFLQKPKPYGNTRFLKIVFDSAEILDF